MTVLFYLILGYVLGRKLPFSISTIRKIYYSIKRIPYWFVYIVEGGKIIDTLMIKKEKNYFNYGSPTKKYSLLIKGGNEEGQESKEENKKKGQSYTPYIILDGYECVFYNKNNINPLIFKEKDIEPGYNDPEMFATLCANRELQNSINDSAELLNDIKRYILISMIVVALAIAGIMWFLMPKVGGA